MMEYIAHHGIKGQKWGERKYQYKDGSLTPEGRARYGGGRFSAARDYLHARQKNVDKFYKRAGGTEDKMPNERTKEEQRRFDKADAQYKKDQARAKAQYKQNVRDIKERKAVERENRQLDKLREQSKRGGAGTFSSLVTTARYSSIGGTTAYVAGRVLIKKALKNNPNLNVNSEALLKQATTVGRNLGTAYGVYKTIQGHQARKKLYGNPNAIPWAADMLASNRERNKNWKEWDKAHG